MTGKPLSARYSARGRHRRRPRRGTGEHERTEGQVPAAPQHPGGDQGDPHQAAQHEGGEGPHRERRPPGVAEDGAQDAGELDFSEAHAAGTSHGVGEVEAVQEEAAGERPQRGGAVVLQHRGQAQQAAVTG